MSNKEKNKITIQQYNVQSNKTDINNINGIITSILNGITEINYIREIEDNTNSMQFNIICSFGIEEIKLQYNSIEKLTDNILEIIHKKDVEFTNLNEIEETYCRKLLKNVLEKYN